METFTIILNILLILIAVVSFTVSLLGGILWATIISALLLGLFGYSLGLLIDNVR